MGAAVPFAWCLCPGVPAWGIRDLHPSGSPVTLPRPCLRAWPHTSWVTAGSRPRASADPLPSFAWGQDVGLRAGMEFPGSLAPRGSSAALFVAKVRFCLPSSSWPPQARTCAEPGPRVLSKAPGCQGHRSPRRSARVPSPSRKLSHAPSAPLLGAHFFKDGPQHHPRPPSHGPPRAPGPLGGGHTSVSAGDTAGVPVQREPLPRA